jgi:uncharacterized membrane-anchored protein
MNERVFPSFPEAAHRRQALGEIHARPYVLIQPERVILQFAFLREGDGDGDHALVSDLSRARGTAAPAQGASLHQMRWGAGTLRWERHTEFSTYLWEGPAAEEFGAPLHGHPFGSGFAPPGPLISAIRLEVRSDETALQAALKQFDLTSLCRSSVKDGQAEIATDFQQDGDGLTRMLLIDRGLTTAAVSALAQRLLDIETYRTLAMLGLPLAQSLSSEVRSIENSLADITQRMKAPARGDDDQLLGQISALAAELEASAALSLYRFGASRAYHEIVLERIRNLAETSMMGYETLGSFLERRLSPAMRTCKSVEERQENLSRKLSRATIQLRTWVDLELERQNGELLASMDRRAKMQLRLQQTVEGLSVAALSYYIVGLIGYLAKAGEHVDGTIDPVMVTGLAVPFVVLAVWTGVRAIRRGHSD